MKRVFPFSPKSNAKLLSGDFWAISLNSGRFACGIVLELPPKELSSKTSFLAGLLDWVGDDLPTFDSIAGSKLIEQGEAHIKTITENDSLILGNRPLELDKIEPFICRNAQFFCKGYSYIDFEPDENIDLLPHFTTWGFGVIKILANKHLDQKGRS